MGRVKLRPRAGATVVAALVVTGLMTACHSSPGALTSARSPSAAGAGTTAVSTSATAPSAATSTQAPTTIPRPTTTLGPTTTTTTIPKDALQLGGAGPNVMQLQQSLTALGYWLGTPDGKFGGTTQQAVWALQKSAGLAATGFVDAATAAALTAGTKPSPQSTSGHVIEVNLARDVLLFVTNGHVDYVLNTSTGGGYVYYDQGSRNVALTPKGHFATTRVIDGQHRSSLGLLFRPRFFVGGFAIHGDSYVPPKPVSHGCVRVSNDAINWIWNTNIDAIGTPVWVY